MNPGPAISGTRCPVVWRTIVAMLEQPLQRTPDDAGKFYSPAAHLHVDAESCHTRDRSPQHSMRGRYEMVNIKLDKTGGLTGSAVSGA